MGKVKPRRLKMLRIVGIFFLLSLVLASLPIPKVKAQIGATYNQVLGGGIPADTIWWVGDSASPEDLWQDDITATNGKGLRPATKYGLTYTTNAAMSLSTSITPADDYEIYLNVNVTAQSGGDGSVVFTFNGLDEYGNAISDALTLAGVGIYTTTIRFASVNTNGVVRSGFTSGESITCRIYQDRWGEVWKIRDGNDIQYKFDANLQVGDASTLSSLSWSSTSIKFADNKKITVTNNATLTLDSMQFSMTGASSGIYGNAGSNATITRSYISIASGYMRLLGTQNVLQHSLLRARTEGYNLDVFDVLYEVDYPFFIATGLNGTFDKISVYGGYAIIGEHYYRTSPVTLSNVYSRGHSYVLRDVSMFGTQTNDVTFIDADFDTWNFYIVGDHFEEIWRKYTFNLQTTFPNETAYSGANVTITYHGNGGGTVGSWLTNGNGSIPEQILSAGFYNLTGGDNIYSYNPYNLQITSLDMKAIDMNFTVMDTLNWRLPLQFNSAPVARFTFSPSNPQPSQSVSFNASASSDPDGYITNYYWTFGDGYSYNSSSPTTTHSYAAASSYIVTLEVTDSQGLKNMFSQTIIVATTDTSTTPSPSIDIYPDYDIQILPLPEYLVHVPFFGESFQATLYLHNKGQFGKETQVTFWIEDENQQKIYEKSESLYVNKLETRDLAVSLTRPAEEGTYTLYAQITSQTRTKTVAQQSLKIYNIIGWLVGPGVIVSVILIVLVACAAVVLLKKYVWY